MSFQACLDAKHVGTGTAHRDPSTALRLDGEAGRDG